MHSLSIPVRANVRAPELACNGAPGRDTPTILNVLRVTRTYRATLAGLPFQAQSGENLLLRALLTTPDGRRLAASHRLTP